MPWFSRAFEACIFGCNVEDPEIGHLIGIGHHLVGNIKSAYFHEIIFKSLQNLTIIDILGKQSDVKNDRIGERGTLTIPRFSRAFAIAYLDEMLKTLKLVI